MEVKSRPLAVGGHSEVIPREGHRGGPTGPAGWGMTVPPTVIPGPRHPTHSGPCRASGARFAGWLLGSSSQQLAGWAPGITLLVPTRYTRPLYPPVPVPTPAPHTMYANVTTRTPSLDHP